MRRSHQSWPGDGGHADVRRAGRNMVGTWIIHPDTSWSSSAHCDGKWVHKQTGSSPQGKESGSSRGAGWGWYCLGWREEGAPHVSVTGLRSGATVGRDISSHPLSSLHVDRPIRMSDEEYNGPPFPVVKFNLHQLSAAYGSGSSLRVCNAFSWRWGVSSQHPLQGFHILHCLLLFQTVTVSNIPGVCTT